MKRSKRLVNIMRMLVAKEVETQLQLLNENLYSGIDLIDIEAYALNRLPPGYATGTRGVAKLRLQLQEKYRSEITAAVKRAIVAIVQNSQPPGAAFAVDPDSLSSWDDWLCR